MAELLTNPVRYFIIMTLRSKKGGSVTRYAEVDEEIYRRWEGYWPKDEASMTREAPKILRMVISEDKFKEIDTYDNLSCLNISMPFVFDEDVQP
jgi:hypothetical protein